jgi:hypothetical protein
MQSPRQAICFCASCFLLHRAVAPEARRPSGSRHSAVTPLELVGLVAVLLQPFDEFLLRGNVVLGLGDVPIHLGEVYQFAIAVCHGGGA